MNKLKQAIYWIVFMWRHWIWFNHILIQAMAIAKAREEMNKIPVSDTRNPETIPHVLVLRRDRYYRQVQYHESLLSKAIGDKEIT